MLCFCFPSSRSRCASGWSSLAAWHEDTRSRVHTRWHCSLNCSPPAEGHTVSLTTRPMSRTLCGQNNSVWLPPVSVNTSSGSLVMLGQEPSDARGRWFFLCGLYGTWRTHGWIYESVICRKTTVSVQNESLYLMFVLSQRSLSAVVIITAEEEEVRRRSRKRGDHC